MPALAPDRFTFASEDLWLSEFRLPPADPDWAAAHKTTPLAFLVAFPRTTVAIRHEHRREVVADPLSAVVYSPGQAYRRRLIAATGDDCTVLAVRPDVVAAVARHFDPSADAETYRLPFAAASVERDAQASITRIRRSLAAGTVTDSEVIREELYWLLEHIVASGYQHSRRVTRTKAAAAHSELVDAVREELGRDVAVSTPLDELARRLAVSPFHLVRVFRSTTGRPIHAYRTELRLRSSLPLIADGVRLADVAQHIGFASHAHLTDRFVRAYAMTPARWRESSKNMEARRGRASLA